MKYLLILTVFLSVSSYAQEIQKTFNSPEGRYGSWTTPALYTNGNPAPASDIGGYIFRWSCEGDDVTEVDITNGSQNTFNLPSLVLAHAGLQ